MSTKRTPEQVHEQDGHPTPVASCSLCHPEPAGERVLVGEHGPDLVELTTGGAVTRAGIEALNEANPSLGKPIDPDVVLGQVNEREAGPGEGPLPDADPAGYPEDAEDLTVEVQPVRRPRAGECRTPGCTRRGTHNGLCHDCHTRPGRTS